MGGSLGFRASVAGAIGAVWLMGWVGPASAITLDLLLGDQENPGAAMLTSYDGTVMFSDFAYHPIRQGPLPRTSEVLPEPNHPDGLVIQTVEGSFDAYGSRSLHAGLGYDAIVLFGNFVWAGGLGGPNNARTVIRESVLGDGQHLIEEMNLPNCGFDRMGMSKEIGLTTLPGVPGDGTARVRPGP